jgi:DNA polymerase-4
MFGEAFGTFLYRAVRGEPAENFERTRGSQSMSAERTFEYDLYDEFVIESALLDICETLIFRLFASGTQCATVSLKIRYGDFTTELIRETFREPVLTLNDLYKHVLDLFHRKYRKGKGPGDCLGIRLIGAGLLNLKENSAQQGDLFEKQNDKERRLEESILKINEALIKAKNPGAVLRRGRSTLTPL